VTFKKCTSDPVHPVHHSPIGAKDDRIRRVDPLDEPKMVDYLADTGNFQAAIKPILRVQVLKALQRNLPEWEISAQTDQSIDIPSVQPFSPRHKVILLSHGITLTQVRVPGLL
jgi:hypothetical protein